MKSRPRRMKMTLLRSDSAINDVSDVNKVEADESNKTNKGEDALLCSMASERIKKPSVKKVKNETVVFKPDNSIAKIIDKRNATNDDRSVGDDTDFVVSDMSNLSARTWKSSKRK